MIQIPELAKDALRDGRMKKNYRFNVLNNDGTTDFTIDNNNLVKESVKIDERMCSGDLLKFGLCEGSSLEFQYFGLANIKGRRIYATIGATYISPSRDFEETVPNVWHGYEVTKSGLYTFKSDNQETGINIRTRWGTQFQIELSASNNYETTEELIKGSTFNVIEHNVVVHVSSPVGINNECIIPMGYFTVAKCSRQASTGIIKVTAYNKLQSAYLDANANNQIVDVVESSVGQSGSVDIGYILNNLLENYAIEPQYTLFNNSPLWYYSTRVEDFEQYSDSNSYMAALICEVHVINWSSQSIQQNNYFKLLANLDKLRALVNSKIAPYSNYLDIRYIAPGSSSGVKRLSEWLESNYIFNSYIVDAMPEIPNAHINFTDYPDGGEVETRYYNYVDMIGFHVAMDWQPHTYHETPFTAERKQAALDEFMRLFESLEYIQVQKREASEIEKTTLTLDAAKALPDVTLRDLQSSVYESLCQFGQLDRETDLFSGVELNSGGLYPSNTLYPSDSLYPSGAGVTSNKSYYSKLWTDEHGAESFRNLVITYKGLDANNQEADFEFTKVVNANGTTDYIMDSNWLFRNLVWTQADISDYADAMAAKMAGIRWFPFEMWCAGLPYVETGDLIEIAVGENTYPSYILQRTLQGIQNLQDTYINGVVDVF